MEQGILGFFQGVAPISANSTIIVTNYEREKKEDNHIYHLREFVDEQTKILYQEEAADSTLYTACDDCAGPGNQTMFARILNVSIQGGKTSFNFIPLFMD